MKIEVLQKEQIQKQLEQALDNALKNIVKLTPSKELLESAKALNIKRQH